MYNKIRRRLLNNFLCYCYQCAVRLSLPPLFPKSIYARPLISGARKKRVLTQQERTSGIKPGYKGWTIYCRGGRGAEQQLQYNDIKRIIKYKFEKARVRAGRKKCKGPADNFSSKNNNCCILQSRLFTEKKAV